MVGIYKITNLVNGKVYIGQSQNIKERWKDHRTDYKRGEVILYRAMRKYGIDNFSFEVIEECSVDELNEKEIYYIAEYNSYIYAENSNGYNMTIGGDGMRGFHHKEVSKEKISSILTNLYKDKEKHPMFGRKLTQETKDKISKSRIGIEGVKKAIICDGKRFNSLEDCASFYNVPISTMSSWLTKLCNMPQEFVDKKLHYEGEDIEYTPSTKPLRRKVECEGQEFPSITKCASFYGVNRRQMNDWLLGKANMPQEFVDKGLRYI